MSTFIRSFLAVILVLVPFQAVFSLPVAFDIQTADFERWFEDIGPRSSVMDADGYMHAAYGGSQLYYATNKTGRWETTIVDTGDGGRHTSIALDSNGHPHISYIGGSVFGSDIWPLKYAFFDGTRWIRVSVDNDNFRGGCTSLALNTSDRPRISYYDYTNKALKYTAYDGAAWHTRTLDSSGEVGNYSSLALDSNGNPHISYADATLSDERLKYIRFNGISWDTPESVDDASGRVTHTSIAIDSSNHPHISYYASSPGCLKYVSHNGAIWGTPQIVDAAGNTGAHSSLVLDTSGNPHISYTGNNMADLRYAAYSGSAWTLGILVSGSEYTFCFTSLSLDGNQPHITYTDGKFFKHINQKQTVWYTDIIDMAVFPGRSSTSLSLDSRGYPHISYYDNIYEDLLYAFFDGNRWTRETVDAEGNVGQVSSLALDAADHPHISYLNGDTHDLKYAFFNGSSWEITTVWDTAIVHGPTSIAIDSNNHPHISYYDQALLSNGNLKYVFHDGIAWQSPVNVDTAGDVGAYASLALDSQGHPHISYYDRGNRNLKYAFWNEGWSAVTVDNTGNVEGYTALALNADDYPCISYISTMGALKYACLSQNSGAWEFDTVDSGINIWTALALDSHGHPHICYDDITNNGDLKYAAHNGTQWTIKKVDKNEGVKSFSSIALDKNDHPFISYHVPRPRCRYLNLAVGRDVNPMPAILFNLLN
ncbi:MAG: hypothetical protein CSA22_07940 [Deltaproteobacteria bacterium]|nr:MAG: hypothetical protein CSA22_07940 [Deltaproteobacteria bacterium]